MGALKVLLVEDKRLLRWWMTSCLERAGFTVLATESLDEATQMASACHPDLLITDWRLADGHDGFEVLTRIREKHPQAMAILLSAEAGAELAGRAREGGFDLVVEKPCPVAEIIGAVHKLAVNHRPEIAS